MTNIPVAEDTTIEQMIVECDDHTFTVSVIDQHHSRLYYSGKDICHILGFKNLNDTLLKHVDPSTKHELSELVSNTTYHDGKVVFLTDSGVDALISVSRDCPETRKAQLRAQLREWEPERPLLDIFAYLERASSPILADINSDWFKELWLPLSKQQLDSKLKGQFNHGTKPKVNFEAFQGPPGGAVEYGADAQRLSRPDVSSENGVFVTTTLLNWLGYTGRKYADQQEKFSRLLTTARISFEEVGCSDSRALFSLAVQREQAELPANVLGQKKWLWLKVRDFKRAVFKLNTKNADLVREYYLNLEEAMLDYGTYTSDWLRRAAEYNEQRLSESMAQLAIKDKEVEEAQAELATKDKEVEEAQRREEEAQRREEEAQRREEEAQRREEEAQRREEEVQLQLATQQRFSNKLKDILVTMKARQKDQVVYIATTKTYAAQNRFKVGGVKTRELLKSRLSTYNSGRPVGDKMYFCYITDTVDYHHLEQRINKILGDHKDAKEAEVYNLHYGSLQPLIEYLADRFDEEVEYHKSLFDRLVKETLEKEPIVPEPVVLNGAEFRRIRNGQVVLTQKVDFEELGEDEQMAFVENVLEEFAILNEGKKLTRVEFESFVASTRHAKFKKTALWAVTKRVAEKLKKKIAYR